MRVVTGVHRSGTSLVAMTLDALGMDFGAHDVFYAADQWNQNGYFERRDVVDLNSRMITGFSRTQGALASTLSKIRYVTQPSTSEIARRGERLTPEIEKVSSLLGDLFVKDPRFALTLDSWRPHVDQVVVCLRRPDHVALSLKRRQRVPVSISYGFWNYHAEALLGSGHDQIHFVDLDVLAGASPEAELRGLARFLGVDKSAAELVATLRSRFSPSLKHFDGEEPDAHLPPKTAELWNALSAQRAPLVGD